MKTTRMMTRGTGGLICLLTMVGLIVGCGGAPEPKVERSAESKVERPAPRHKPTRAAAKPRRETASKKPASPGPAEKGVALPTSRAEPTPRSLADLLETPPDSAARMIPDLPRLTVDDARAAKAGIRKLSGKHLDLYTDFPPSPEIDVLPEIFDQAFPQWCAYFHVDPAQHADWRVTGFLIQRRPAFEEAELLPDDLPPFRHAYARNFEFWLYPQPSDYYRRHLVLHEGTHCFMNTLLGACGPPWYMEGMAELMSTHLWRDGHLRLNHVPANREETPMWGRIKIIKDAFAAGNARRLKAVLAYDARAHVRTEPYAWCWAACLLMDRHPRYQARFRQLYRDVLRPDFNRRFYQAMGDDWPRLAEEWEVLVAGLEYGHDVGRGVLDFTPGKALPAEGAQVDVAADRGWQNSGLRLEKGKKYHLRAEGRYQVADQPRIWWCEPGGVSIRYYQGRPLGILLAAVRPDQPADGPSALLRPHVVGLETVFAPERSGTLFLKINDSAAELNDNAGKLGVQIGLE